MRARAATASWQLFTANGTHLFDAPGCRTRHGVTGTLAQANVVRPTTELCLSPTTVPSDSTIAEGHTPRSMTAVGQGTVRRTTQFPVPLLRTNVKPARSKRVRVPL